MRRSQQLSTSALGDEIHGAALLAGGANVIMQLARKPVGHGVMYSPVASGNIWEHPIKRTRTTLAYLMTAMRGTEGERRALRKQIDRVHAHVRSGPDAEMPYNALDPELQLWVAACLYRGVEDSYQAFVGDLDDATADALYQDGKHLGTTLQVREESWPSDRNAFEEYWTKGLALIDVDEPTREYLLGIARLRFYGRPVSWLLGGFGEFVTTGFLHPTFRDALRLRWDDRKQRRFDALLRAIRLVNLVLPRMFREFPLNLVWWDTRRRLRTGKPVI
ncbi:MAG: DUF2236 domain-containing protein [Actinophytocola sp.]|nr:DUF2236 domain-containing protein [Actinophytocola sp.]